VDSKKEEEDSIMRYYILPAVAVVLVVLYFIPMLSSKGPSYLVNLNKKGIKEIEVKRGDTLYRFQNNEKGWQMVEPIRWKADEGKIKSLIEKVLKTRLENPITRDKDKYRDYKVTDSDDYITLKTPRSSETIVVGKRGPKYSLVYVRRKGDRGVYLVDASFVDALPDSKDEFRDRTILSLKKEDIKAVRWTLQKESFSMRREKDGWYSEEKKLPEERVSAYLNGLSIITASGFPEKDELPEGATEEGALQITADREYLLKLFKAKEEYFIFYKDHVYKISEFRKNELFRKVSSEES
jgi:hypothetical protein